MNLVNSILRIPIKDYIGLLKLTIDKSNVGKPNKGIDQSAARIKVEMVIENDTPAACNKNPCPVASCK